MAGSSIGASPRLASAPLDTPRAARLDAWLAAHTWLVLGALYALALGLRLLYLADFRHGLLSQVPLMDEAYYRAEAWSLLRGAPPASDVWFMTPLYPVFLSWVFRLVGDGPLGPAAVQLALGALAAPLTFLVARRAVRPILALATGVAIASFAPLVFFESLFLVEGLVLLGLLAALAFAVATPARWHHAALCGAALGLATLGRGSNLALALPLAAWFWLEACGARRVALRRVTAFALGLIVVVAPLLVRNAARAGRPFLLTANAGFNFYIGNGPEATGVFVRIPGVDWQQDPLTLRYVQRQLHRPVSASETSDYWMARTRTWVAAHPGHALQLFLWKLLLFWNRMSIPQVEGFESAAPGTALARPPFWRSFLFLPLALLGTAAAFIRLVRRRQLLTPLERVRVLLAVFALVYSASIALFFVTDRYRVPILPCLMVLAVCGIETILAAAAPGRRRTLPLLLALAALAVAATDPARLGVDRRRMRRDLHAHAALRYAQAQQFDAALDEYRAALALDPNDADTRDGWARMLGRAGQDSTALDAFHDLLRDRPDDARAWYNLGNLERRMGRRDAAKSAYEHALALEPDREAAWNHLGEVYRAMGDTARAAECYLKALAIVPAHEPALNNLAALRAQQGHAAEAEAGWRAALAANPRHLPSLVNLAILLTDSGRTSEASSMWRRVLSVDPGNTIALRVLPQLDPTAVLPQRQGPNRKPGEED